MLGQFCCCCHPLNDGAEVSWLPKNKRLIFYLKRDQNIILFLNSMVVVLTFRCLSCLDLDGPKNAPSSLQVPPSSVPPSSHASKLLLLSPRTNCSCSPFSMIWHDRLPQYLLRPFLAFICNLKWLRVSLYSCCR